MFKDGTRRRPADAGASAPREKHPNALDVPDALLDALAARVVDGLAKRMPEPVEPYLSADDAAEYLACKRARIYELIEQRRLKHFRDGRRVLLRRVDLDAVLDVREAE